MIKQSDTVWGKVLFEQNLPPDEVEAAFALLDQSPELTGALSSPVVSAAEKRRVAERIFPVQIADFVCLMCENNALTRHREIYEAYDRYVLESRGGIDAALRYFVMPAPEQLEKIKRMICTKYKRSDVRLILTEDKSLLGGFVLCVNGYEYDRSIKNSLENIRKRLLWR
ncbi:MAG: F0F1 ATP synthase subunit delta [Oscillospiraceae bacterium]